MRLKFPKLTALLLGGAVLATSCVGSFPLFNKLASWNKKATGCKILNELIFLVISPAYAVCTLADVLVFNSIEFWTGDTPLAQVGESRQVMGTDGVLYTVTTLSDGYEVKTPDGQVQYLTYEKQSRTWSLKQDGQVRRLVRVNDDGTVRAFLPDGQAIDVTADQAGVQQLRQAMECPTFFAFR